MRLKDRLKKGIPDKQDDKMFGHNQPVKVVEIAKKNNNLDSSVFDTSDKVHDKEISINIRGKSTRVDSSKNKGRNRKRYIFRIIALFIILAVLSVLFYYINTIFVTLNKSGISISPTDSIGILFNLANQQKVDVLKDIKQTDGKTNFLLIGVDARKGFSSLLTDSIMIFSYDHSTNSVLQISLPRDLRAKYGSGFTKINSVFPFSYSNELSRSADVNKAYEKAFENLSISIKDITGLEIHYGMLINFRGFVDFIDSIGGVEIFVERSFTDYDYPSPYGDGTITIYFNQGWQKMDGERALIYARSRKGDNGEGSDYQRARRQQKVVQAVIDKIRKNDIFSNINAINDILNIFGDNIRFYQVDKTLLEKAFSAKDLLINVFIESIVIDPDIGSFPGQVLKTSTDDIIGFHVYPVSGDYKDVRYIIRFFQSNSGLLRENPKITLIYNDNKLVNDYLKIKQNLFSKFIKFDFFDYPVKTKLEDFTTETDNTLTQSPSIVDNGGVQYSSDLYFIYKKNTDKTKTIEVYRKLLDEMNLDYQIIQSGEFPDTYLDSDVVICYCSM
ncbi:MAG: LCP family protein [Candidatus Dojkabacteria bacterium]|nr:LCP family protein [Candidatus Dojkabacteria bacterium]